MWRYSIIKTHTNCKAAVSSKVVLNRQHWLVNQNENAIYDFRKKKKKERKKKLKTMF